MALCDFGDIIGHRPIVILQEEKQRKLNLCTTFYKKQVLKDENKRGTYSVCNPIHKIEDLDTEKEEEGFMFFVVFFIITNSYGLK